MNCIIISFFATRKMSTLYFPFLPWTFEMPGHEISKKKNGVYSFCPLFGQIAEIKGLCWRASHWKSRLFKSYFPRRFLWKVNQESIQKRRRENQQACSHLLSTIKFPGGPKFCKFMKYKEKNVYKSNSLVLKFLVFLSYIPSFFHS